ncbi:MAG TPA: HD-GYP domain-containing protein [Thermoleophilaceae bacterium]
MRLVATNRLTPEMTLGRDVVTGVHGQLPLLRAGVRLRPEYQQALRDAGVHAVYVEDELGAGIEVPQTLSEQTREKATKALQRSFGEAPALAAAGDALPESSIAELATVAELICTELAGAEDAVLAFSDLAAADQYTLQHSIDVTALGILIARTRFQTHGHPAPLGKRGFDQIDRQLVLLGVGLLLHDVGKVSIPDAILNKPGPLDADEMALMRTHPQVGIELLPGDMVGPLAKSVVRSHHERWDGAGYPHGVAGLAIPEFARIAAVADVFDAITSERPYASAQPASKGVRVIVENAGTQFDAEIVDTFRKLVAPYPPGSEIVLADGRRAIVVSVPPVCLELPLVRVYADAAGPVAPQELDLAAYPEYAPRDGLAPAA